MAHPFRALLLLAVLGLPFSSPAESANPVLARATAAVEAATPRAQADPAHPLFHITAPAQWMNDPNGPIFYKGYYHLFYQFHPFSDSSGPKYWGHVRSRDLVHWQPLPIALWPSTEAGETEVWSGCCTINGLGQPMCFYTSIGPAKEPFDHSDQWAAIGDDGLIHWQKSPANPVLPRAVNGATNIYDWRDPFIFHDQHQTFLVTGGHLAPRGHAAVNLYEAENPELTRWKYRGVMFWHPDAGAPTVECPNFFKLGDQWVLLVSPYGQVQYFVGDFDAGSGRFHAHSRGILDYGSSFYAPNTMQVPDGRRLVWGWVNGFPPGHGWNGCLSLPRCLSLSKEGQLQQFPAPQLRKLRGKAVGWRNFSAGPTETTLALPATNTLEISAALDLGDAQSVVLKIGSGTRDKSPLTLKWDGRELSVLDAKAPLAPTQGGRKLALDIFIDRSVLEIFANQTVCLTKTIAPPAPQLTLALSAQGGPARVARIEAWTMKTIW